MPSTSLTPIWNRVIVKLLPPKTKTEGGIHIPESAQQTSLECEVVAVGPGRRLENGTIHPTTLKPGDRVFIGIFKWSQFEIDGVQHLIMREDEILAVVDP